MHLQHENVKITLQEQIGRLKRFKNARSSSSAVVTPATSNFWRNKTSSSGLKQLQRYPTTSAIRKRVESSLLAANNNAKVVVGTLWSEDNNNSNNTRNTKKNIRRRPFSTAATTRASLEQREEEAPSSSAESSPIPLHRLNLQELSSNNNNTSNQAILHHWKSRVEDTVSYWINNMGACLSSGGGKALIEGVNGGEEAYHTRYLEDKVLGEGQFGVVKLVHDMQAKDKAEGASSVVCASKQLRKGVVFKDNTLYTPLKPEVLQAECDILRTLAGEHFCLKLVGIYESRSIIWMVTELCQGGEMMEYVAQQDELRTEDVSRISYQMLSAVDHCAQHGVLHRDIKPENTMFISAEAGAELRLIDFGSGCLDDAKKAGIAPPEQSELELQQHTTFAGTAFYISPEMFQKNYTSKTDVWSVGVCLYVLVAGYPSDVLQRAFNMLQKSKRNLRDLPHMPDDVPDTYIELLDHLLVYRHKERKSAGWALKNSEFVQFHKQLETEGLDLAQVIGEATSMPEKPGSIRRTQSINLSSSVQRHSIFVDYKSFERSVTSLLASMLQPKELDTLLEEIVKKSQTEEEEDAEGHKSKLKVVQIKDLKSILAEMKKAEVLGKMSHLPNAMTFNSFAYHWKLLKEFQGRPTAGGRSMKRANSTSGAPSSVHGTRVFRAASASLRGADGAKKAQNSSWHGGTDGAGQQKRASSVF